MEQLAFESMEPKKRREDRLREAKMLFSDGSSAMSVHTDGYEEKIEDFGRREGHIFFYRPLISFLLFVVLVMACHFQVSVHGIDRNRVEQILSDDTHYKMLVKQAETVIKNIGAAK